MWGSGVRLAPATFSSWCTLSAGLPDEGPAIVALVPECGTGALASAEGVAFAWASAGCASAIPLAAGVVRCVPGTLLAGEGVPFAGVSVE